tara:strand:- start:2026 stop:3078 length:1053 start_codon:yes stop_codon:yes gene_type:complete
MSINKRNIGNTNLGISELGMGTAPIGGWPIEINENEALITLDRAWKRGIRYFDTAPLYGSGMAEHRLGKFLKNKSRNDYVVATKVGRIIIDTDSSKAAEKFAGSPKDKDSKFDFSYDGVMKSFEDSLNRLDMDYVDVLHLHDPDNHPNHLDQARRGAIKAMIKLKEDKAVKVLGCGMNQNEMLVELSKEGCFDCFLLAGRYSLIDQTSLDSLIPTCEKNKISLILGGVFNSGILINPSPNTYFDYTKLDENWFNNLKQSLVRIPKDHESSKFWLDKAYALKEACNKFNTSLKKAAIQFPYANSVVSSCILGMSSPLQVDENVNDYQNKLSSKFWSYLKENELIDKRSPIV